LFRRRRTAVEYGLAVDLDTVIADVTQHRDELRLMPSRWT
jgi:hypothetical protein